MSAPLRPSRALLAGLVAVPLVLASVGVANASHFRASASQFSLAGDVATWVVQSAWEAGDDDVFESDTIGDSINVTAIASDAELPGTGSSTGATLQLINIAVDDSNPLFALTTQTFSGDLSSLGDGMYEIYLQSCCRVGDVQNAPNGGFAQWIRFTKSEGSYDLPPGFTASTLYAVIDPAVPLVLNYPTADPESGVVATSLVTDDEPPYYGATGLECSTFSGGVLTLSAALCGPEDDFSAIYTPGSFWAAKVSATDAAGNETVVDTLMRVASAPQPYIDYHDTIGNGTSAEFSVVSEDNPVDSWTITCVAVDDSADVVVASTSSAPASTVGSVVVHGLTVGETYVCEVEATNAYGVGSSDDAYEIGPIELNGVDLALDLEVGDRLSDGTAQLSGAGLEPDSDWTLVQHSAPLTLASGVADGLGAFTSSLSLPTAACVPGVHTLTLTGESPKGGPLTDSVWYELDGNCIVLQLSTLGPVTAGGSLAAAGVEPDEALLIGAVSALVLGAGLLVLARRRAVTSQRS